MSTQTASVQLIHHTALATPIGILHLFGSERGLATLTLPNESRESAESRLLRRFGRTRTHVQFDEDETSLSEPVSQLGAYFVGRLRRFDLPLDHGGTPFQTAVWAAVIDIPYGETRTYADIAIAIGMPTATRAVGAAIGANPLPLICPCQRVIGSNGTLTGYGGGLQLKERLLAWERHCASQSIEQALTMAMPACTMQVVDSSESSIRWASAI